jgi:hypothetical protein
VAVEVFSLVLLFVIAVTYLNLAAQHHGEARRAESSDAREGVATSGIGGLKGRYSEGIAPSEVNASSIRSPALTGRGY